MKDLTVRDERLLNALLARREVSRSDLLIEAYNFPGEFSKNTNTRRLDVHIGRLRKKVDKEFKIIARYGIGYTVETVK